MKNFHNHRKSTAISFAMLFSLLVSVLVMAGPSVEQYAANESTIAESQVEERETKTSHAITLPESHQVCLDALQKTRKLDYKLQTAQACIADLSKTLGMTIKLHPSMATLINPKGKVNLAVNEPISHQTAIFLIMRNFGLRQYGIVFENNELTLVMGTTYKGEFLRTYNFRGRSNYSTAQRQCIMASLVTEVRPESWVASKQKWLQKGESVFEIDIYQSQEVHNLIGKRVNSQVGIVAVDPDVQKLSSLGFSPKGKDDKKVDKEAIVKRLREKYPYTSIADRLKYQAAKTKDAPKLSPASQMRIDQADKQFDQTQKAKHAYVNGRSESLRLLHEAEVKDFIARPGAGFGRMRLPSSGPSFLPGNPPRDIPLVSNDKKRPNNESPVSLPETNKQAAAARVFLPSQQSLLAFHQNGQLGFVSPNSVGYIKNRNQVAGFHSHGFVTAPQLLTHFDRPWYRKEKEMWAIHRLELVSLLKHDKPAVYVSKSLPNMKELKNVKTRDLASFEAHALKQLQQGKDVVTNATLNRIEMLGALRATKQCMQCHDVKRGALLGAFSYQMHRDPALDPNKNPVQVPLKPVF